METMLLTYKGKDRDILESMGIGHGWWYKGRDSGPNYPYTPYTCWNEVYQFKWDEGGNNLICEGCGLDGT